MRVFWLDSEFIIGQLRQRAEELVRDGRAKNVILFGSLATGRAVPGSDADILIVVEDDDRRLKDRMAEYLESFSGFGIAVDVFPYTHAELDNPIAKHAHSEGIVLASAE